MDIRRKIAEKIVLADNHAANYAKSIGNELYSIKTGLIQDLEGSLRYYSQSGGMPLVQGFRQKLDDLIEDSHTLRDELNKLDWV